MTNFAGPIHGLRAPVRFIDERGIPCFRVPLDDEGQSHALIECDDYDHIVKAIGCHASWCVTPNGHGGRYVVVNLPKTEQGCGLVTVSRLFMGAEAKQRVRYLTADTLDLRRSNLSVEPGAGRARHNGEERMREALRQQAEKEIDQEDEDVR